MLPHDWDMKLFSSHLRLLCFNEFLNALEKMSNGLQEKNREKKNAATWNALAKETTLRRPRAKCNRAKFLKLLALNNRQEFLLWSETFSVEIWIRIWMKIFDPLLTALHSCSHINTRLHTLHHTENHRPSSNCLHLFIVKLDFFCCWV